MELSQVGIHNNKYSTTAFLSWEFKKGQGGTKLLHTKLFDLTYDFDEKKWTFYDD